MREGQGDHITQVAMQQPWTQLAFESDRPSVGKASGSFDIEAKKTPAAQPLMYNQLEDMMEAKCKNKDPTWPALLAIKIFETGVLIDGGS